MPHNDTPPPARGKDVHPRRDKVESPQQYSTWRDYAFSDLSEEEDGAAHH